MKIDKIIKNSTIILFVWHIVLMATACEQVFAGLIPEHTADPAIMLSPQIAVDTPGFSKVFKSYQSYGVNAEHERLERLKEDLWILYAVSNRIKRKVLRSSFKLTPDDIKSISYWLIKDEQNKRVMPEPRVLKKLFINLIAMASHGNPQIKSQSDIWMPRIAERWGISENNLRNLFQWFDKSISDIKQVQEVELSEFLQEFLYHYRTNDNVRENFIYLIDKEMDDNEKLQFALINMRKMSSLFSEDFLKGKTMIKAKVAGTKYFIGMRFGQYATGGTFVNEILLGEEQGTLNPLAGVFYRLGFDTEGSSIRVTQIGGVQYKKPVVEDFTENVGVTPDKALFFLLLEFAKQNGFENMVGVRKQLLNNSKEIKMSYMAKYKSFGITRNHPLGKIRNILSEHDGKQKIVFGLVERWEEKRAENENIDKALKKIRAAFFSLKEIPAILERSNIGQVARSVENTGCEKNNNLRESILIQQSI